MLKLILLLFTFTLLSCAVAKGPLYTEVDMDIPPGKGRIIVMRAPAVVGAALAANFYLDGKKIASLHNNGFNYVFVEPGNYVVSHGTDSDREIVKADLEVQDGGAYYVYLQRDYGSHFRIIMQEHAERLLVDGQYKLQVLN